MIWYIEVAIELGSQSVIDNDFFVNLLCFAVRILFFPFCLVQYISVPRT